MSTDSRTASPSPLTPATLLADEAALKRVFDAEFDGSLAAAKSQLGDAQNLAPRVLETAFLNLWNQRATIATQAQLKAALTEEVRHGSARALSRRASAGRFAGGKQSSTGQHAVAEASKADVWSRVENGLKGPGTAAHAAAADAGRHEAAKQMKTMAKRPSWIIPVTIGVIALGISLAGMFYVDRLGEDDATISEVNNAGIQPLASSVGQIGNILLGDSSKMRVGPETKIYIPDHFPEKVHALKVDGTAAFEVAPVKQGGLPFRIVAKKVHVIATGTSFAVSAYQSDSGVAVLVKEGTVTIKIGKVTQAGTSGQAYIVDNGAIRPATDAERAERLGWVDGTMTLTNKPLKEVTATLARWGFDVKVPDAQLLTRPATISVPFDSTGHPVIKEHMDQVEKSANVKLGSEGTNWVLRDATGAPASKAPAKAPAKAAAKPAAKAAGKKK
jgi:ferric-dicitrate binding protein FerR (iron transport regulator)